MKKGKNHDQQVVARMPKPLVERLDREALRSGSTRSKITRAALDRELRLRADLRQEN